MKIPPRTMFWSQVVATTFSCFIQIVVLNLALTNIPDVCEQHQRDRFTCPGGRVFYAGMSFHVEACLRQRYPPIHPHTYT